MSSFTPLKSKLLIFMVNISANKMPKVIIRVFLGLLTKSEIFLLPPGGFRTPRSVFISVLNGIIIWNHEQNDPIFKLSPALFHGLCSETLAKALPETPEMALPAKNISKTKLPHFSEKNKQFINYIQSLAFYCLVAIMKESTVYRWETKMWLNIAIC